MEINYFSTYNWTHWNTKITPEQAAKYEDPNVMKPEALGIALFILGILLTGPIIPLIMLGITHAKEKKIEKYQSGQLPEAASKTHQIGQSAIGADNLRVGMKRKPQFNVMLDETDYNGGGKRTLEKMSQRADKRDPYNIWSRLVDAYATDDDVKFYRIMVIGDDFSLLTTTCGPNFLWRLLETDVFPKALDCIIHTEVPCCRGKRKPFKNYIPNCAFEETNKAGLNLLHRAIEVAKQCKENKEDFEDAKLRLKLVVARMREIQSPAIDAASSSWEKALKMIGDDPEILEVLKGKTSN